MRRRRPLLYWLSMLWLLRRVMRRWPLGRGYGLGGYRRHRGMHYL
jgi:hypothetical protein